MEVTDARKIVTGKTITITQASDMKPLWRGTILLTNRQLMD